MTRPSETRVYTFTGKVAHLIPITESPSLHRPAALCGRLPAWFSDWLGTGSQAEYEKAAALPTCAYCVRRQAEDAQPWPEFLGPQAGGEPS